MEKQQHTTIRITVELWKKLNDLRIDPKTSPEDVIWNFIKFNEEQNETE